MAKLVVMIRVKDGILFVREWLERFDLLVDEIVALDNGSTDGTLEVLAAHPKVVTLLKTEGYNEGRDKNMLLEAVRERNPDWCLWIDVDELFEANLTRKHFDRLMSRPLINKYSFRRFHFIDRNDFAVSKKWLNYSSGHDRVMWRNSPDGYFENLILDSPNIKGIKGLTVATNFRLKHLGYISKELVDKKADTYRKVSNGEKEASIQGMYLGDEKRMTWSDNRKSAQVILLNWRLNSIMLKHKIPAAFRKLKGLLKGRSRKLNTSYSNI